jgi:hypothetical protein
MGHPPTNARHTLQLPTQQLTFVDHVQTITKEEDCWHQPVTKVVVAIVIKAFQLVCYLSNPNHTSYSLISNNQQVPERVAHILKGLFKNEYEGQLARNLRVIL